MNGPAQEAVRPITDKRVFLDLMMRAWGSHHMMIGVRIYDCAELPLTGLFASTGELLAVASWTVDGDVAVLCALHALKPGDGAATRLLAAVKELARTQGAARLRAMVTNDNLPAMAFYQKQGFRFSDIYIEAVDIYRSVVPTIVATGYQGIPIRDALELEIGL